MKKLLYFISIALLFSCKEKNKPQVIEGFIREYYSGKPLPKVRVILFESKSEILGQVIFNLVADTYTDERGHYSFYDADGREKNYVVKIFDPSSTHHVDDFYDLNNKHNKNALLANFNLYKITPVKLHVTNSTGKLRSIYIFGNSSRFSSAFDKINADTVVYETCYYGKTDVIEGVVYEGSFGKVLFNINQEVSFTNPDTNYLEINISK